jgi:phage shock protein PspC (stress-responsive transcriptional regulator)
MSVPKTQIGKLDKETYEKLGKAVEATLVQDYIQLLHSTRRQIWSSFVRGIFAGLGSVIGATLVVAALLWILAIFGTAPVIGDFFRSLGQSLKQ